MSATEVARNFSAVLDSVSAGETVVITRGGERVATVSPTPRANGAALAAILSRWHDDPALDDDWAARVADAHRALNAGAELDRDPWQG